MHPEKPSKVIAKLCRAGFEGPHFKSNPAESRNPHKGMGTTLDRKNCLPCKEIQRREIELVM
ncbi:MAG: hypothetical protein AUK00_02905 [Dehalococcoidia bacterium CG2_30_46_9]|nr:MAG: hypothetical protein AUK00_02905 [Dehalococcoidia bacterium CG2_30_46_9]